ncbi:FAD-binding domain-containing protein [Hypoxylon sp. NC1633]|nr:FAD-binding domain-containing protein [Hypoxylon sp. NC1633]
MAALRSFLLALTFAPVLAHSHALQQQPRAEGGDLYKGGCKAAPGSQGWPSEKTWAAFNQSTGGKLIRAVPPGAVCHPSQPTYNAAQCATVAAEWPLYDFHTSDPVSNMWQQYNNDTCLPDPGAPCSPAGYPAYVVNATSARDVKLGLEFARAHNIRVVVKSSGHDYQGRSQAPGALSIWVHHMQGLETHTSFQPQGCSFTIEEQAVTAQGGTQVGFVYEELDKIDRTIVGGGAKTVSVGGYITGGGHSILAPTYGLAVDQVLQMEVVTPMGDILVANECQNQDLFWAMRGGGGSTFGVLTAVTLITYPTPQMVGLDIALFADLNATFVWDMVGYVLSQYPYLDSKGISGYGYFSKNFSYGPITGAGAGGFFAIVGTQDVNDMLAIWAPILAHVNETWPGVTPILLPAAYPRFIDWFHVYYDQEATGADVWIGSHLLDANSLTKDPKAMGEAYKVFDGSGYLVAGQGVKNAKPRGGSNAMNPSWRKTISHSTTSTVFPPLNRTAKIEALAAVNARTEPLRQLAPGMGAYINENNPAEPDWQHAFWGENYDRLLQIKRAIDPLDVLWCHPCVGNERWKEVGYQLCRA